MSNQLLRNNTESKNRLGALSAQPADPASTPRCAQGRPDARAHGRVAGTPAPCRRRLRSLSQALHGRVVGVAPGHVATQQPSSLFGHNTPRCIAIQILELVIGRVEPGWVEPTVGWAKTG